MIEMNHDLSLFVHVLSPWEIWEKPFLQPFIPLPKNVIWYYTFNKIIKEQRLYQVPKYEGLFRGMIFKNRFIKEIKFPFFLKKSYTKAVEVKSERTKPSANKFGAKGTKQNATPSQVDIYLKALVKDLLQIIPFVKIWK